ncbi:DMT family transporter [Alkaliphilus hydrothermalis]|uniref:Drug/metabolite transporter (DMT)-like permease n=1 Tax=Alkaliphilus hydrothermalis TaxID=1482730 RepID=A0ABS2NMH7_9FIRM|nr:DMT family transporter [Alkaliphilus hydrothermalis]MBM7613779.1 drug/metabolite transporter (DMT)-like permease [Alkaliphilus hydrothermalis]
MENKNTKIKKYKMSDQSNKNEGFDSHKILTNRWSIVGLALLCSLLWGSAFPVLKVSYLELGIGPEDISAKILLAGFRFFLASMLLFGLVAFGLRKNLKVEKKLYKELIVLGILQTTLQYFFFYNGLGNTTGIKGSVLTSMGSFFVVIFAHFIYDNDKINSKKTIGLIAGFAGIILMNGGKEGLDTSFVFKGEGYVILASLMNATGMIIAKSLTKHVNPFLVTAWQMLMGSILLIVWGLTGLGGEGLKFTPVALGLLLYSAFLSATAFSLWYALLRHNKAGEISLYKFMVPVSGALLSVIFIPGERLTPYMLGALGLVSIGIIAVNYDKNTSITHLKSNWQKVRFKY